jgi:hypothetical protein
MKRCVPSLALLLMISWATAQEETSLPEPTAADIVEETPVTNAMDTGAATTIATADDATNVVTSGESTNAVTAAEGTNRIEEADAVLLGLRDPFWPVGYEPPPPEPERTDQEIEQAKVEEEIEKKIKWPALQLKGITHAGKDRYMAIVAGVGLVESGQTVSLRKDEMLYSWLVEEVSRKGLKFTRLEARPYQPPTIGVRTQ